MKLLCALLVVPGLAGAGVLYDVEVRPLDQTNMALASPGAAPAAPVVTQYFSDEGKVRVGGPNAKMVYLFKDGIMYAIDNSSRAVHVLKHATLSQVSAHYTDAVKQLEAAAAGAPADQRAEAERKAADQRPMYLTIHLSFSPSEYAPKYALPGARSAQN